MSEIPEPRSAADYHALRGDAAAIDLPDWTVLRLRGPDARAFLQGMATQDLAPLRRDRAALTFFLTEKGRPVALAWVASGIDRAGPDAAAGAGAPTGGAAAEVLHVIADAGARDTLRPHFERFRVMENVEFDGPGDMPRLVGVAGPARDRIVADAGGVIHGAAGFTASPISFLLLPPDVPTISLPHIVERAAFEAWRLAVGLPLTGVDFDTDRLVTELSLPEAISLTKGCYVGQEVVARTSTRGQVRRRRVGFRFDWPGGPIPGGTEIRAGGVPAGFVTSTAAEPETGQGLGMGYLTTAETATTRADLRTMAGDREILLRAGDWPL